MTSPRLATYSIGGTTRYGAVTDSGIVDLSARFGKEFPTLREAVAAGALMKLAEDARTALSRTMRSMRSAGSRRSLHRKRSSASA